MIIMGKDPRTSKSQLKNVSKLKLSKQCLPSERLVEGKAEFGDCGSSLEKLPSWFNLDLARNGQKFARERLYGICHSHLIGIFVLIADGNLAKPVYYTQKPETTEKGLPRYLAIFNQIRLWYDSEITSDLTSPFFTSLRKLRAIYRAAGQLFKNERPDFSQPLVMEEKNATPGERLWEAFKKDLESSKVANKITRLGKNLPSGLQFSQFHMMLTQWSFVALPILFPTQVGLHGAKEEELLGFVHLWAIIGHSLGIKPEYNICLVPDVKAFKTHANWVYHNHVFPGFFDVSCESEVLWKALGEGVSKIVPFVRTDSIILQLLEDFMEVPCPNFRLRISWLTTLQRLFQKFIVKPLYYYKWFQEGCNAYLRGMTTQATKKFLGLDSSNDKEISQKAFDK